MTVKNLLWTLPFLCFLAGYLMTNALFHTPTISTPSVVGKSLDEALSILSSEQLTLQLLDQKEDSVLPHNTVLAQIPAPGQYTKPRQTVFLSLSKQPPIMMTPSFIGKQLPAIEQEARTAKLRLKPYFLPSMYPVNSCITQIPMAGTPTLDKIVAVYISKGNPKEIIWPKLTQKPLRPVVEFLEHHGITPQIIELSEATSDDAITVIEQRPLAGSIISLDEKHLPIVQLFTR